MSIVILKPMVLNALMIFFFNLSLCVPLVCSTIPRPSSLYRPMLPKPTMLVILSSKNRPTRSQISAPWKDPMAMSKLESAFFLHQMVLLWHSTDWQECKITSVSSSVNFVYLLANLMALITCVLVIEG